MVSKKIEKNNQVKGKRKEVTKHVGHDVFHTDVFIHGTGDSDEHGSVQTVSPSQPQRHRQSSVSNQNLVFSELLAASPSPRDRTEEQKKSSHKTLALALRHISRQSDSVPRSVLGTHWHILQILVLEVKKSSERSRDVVYRKNDARVISNRWIFQYKYGTKHGGERLRVHNR